MEHIKHGGIVAQQHCSLPTPSNISKATTFFEHETEHAELSKNQSILLLLQKNTCKSLIFFFLQNQIKLNKNKAVKKIQIIKTKEDKKWRKERERES